MATLIKNANGTFNLVEGEKRAENLTTIQMQNVMLKLDFNPEALFECLIAFAENPGHDFCALGYCGSFMYSGESEKALD